MMVEQINSAQERPMRQNYGYESNAFGTLQHYLPKWLKVQNNLAPAVYEQVWNAVKLAPAYQYCDTRIITQFFTTSGLSLEKLGYLWSLSNVSAPGFLTQQELYIMLTAIALVQAGYAVDDISMLKNINHPILPQLDYSYLHITVANPAINRNYLKNSQSRKFDNVSDNIVKPDSKNSSLSDGQFCSNVLPCDNLRGTNNFQNAKKSDMKTTDLLPGRNIIENSEFESLVDFVTPFCSSVPNGDSSQSFPLNSRSSISNLFGSTDLRVLGDDYGRLTKQAPYSFTSSLNSLNSTEPRSLDLPIVLDNSRLVDDEDEFTEFQSATMPPIDEYSDFQSVSPIGGFNFDDLKNDSFVSDSSKSDETHSVSNVAHYPPSSEIDKYDIFRMLMHPKKNHDSLDESKNGETNGGDNNDDDDDDNNNNNNNNNNNKEEGDDDDEDKGEQEDEEFSDFYVANLKENESGREITIKEKCLQACLRLLQEGLCIFTSISTEEIVKEVLHHEKGYRYFNQLKIVYETSLRFQRQFENVSSNDSLQSTWAKLSMFIKYIPSDEFYDEIPAEDDNDALHCKLCETKCDVNCVRYAGNDYHVTCINLFLHFVEGSEISTMLYI